MQIKRRRGVGSKISVSMEGFEAKPGVTAEGPAMEITGGGPNVSHAYGQKGRCASLHENPSRLPPSLAGQLPPGASQRTTPAVILRSHEKTRKSTTIGSFATDLEMHGRCQDSPPSLKLVAPGGSDAVSPASTPTGSPCPSPSDHACASRDFHAVDPSVVLASSASSPPSLSSPSSPVCYNSQLHHLPGNHPQGLIIGPQRLSFMSRSTYAPHYPNLPPTIASAAATMPNPGKKGTTHLLAGGPGPQEEEPEPEAEQQLQQRQYLRRDSQQPEQCRGGGEQEEEEAGPSSPRGARAATAVNAALGSPPSSTPPPSRRAVEALHNGPPAAAVSPSSPFLREKELLWKTRVPEFSLALPTPREDPTSVREEMLASTTALPVSQPVRFGAVIRLWVKEELEPGRPVDRERGGFLGYAARDLRRIQGALPQGGRLNVGMNDTFFVLPPYQSGRGWHVREAYFRVEDAAGGGQRREGETVRYGEELLLVDEEDNVMCHFRGRKHIRRKPRGTKGEMSVALLPPREDMLGSDVLYGDTNIRLQLATRRGLKTEAVALSALRRDSIDAVGGFLNCLGRGQELNFDIEHAPPHISEITLTTSMSHGHRQFLSRSHHHRVPWGQTVSFVTPSCQDHAAAAHEGCLLRVTLSNGSRLKMRQGHCVWTEIGEEEKDRGFEREPSGVWLPTKGIEGEDVDLLVRLVRTETAALDPRRHFPGATLSATSAGPNFSASSRLAPLTCNALLASLARRLPQDCPLLVHAALFLLLEALLAPGGPAGPAPLLARLATRKDTALAFSLASLLYAGLQWLLRRSRPDPRAPPVPAGATPASFASSLKRPQARDGLPATMLFDKWELLVLDWRPPLDAAAISPAGLPSPAPVPPTFLEAEKGDEVKARARWARTQAWRASHQVDQILAQPHPKFSLIKRHYPQAFHFRDKEGHVCFYELLGRLQVGELLRQGVSLSDLTEHVILQQEFLWGVLQPEQSDRVTLVLDLKGVSLADVTGEVVNVAKMAVGLTSTHYPARSCRTLILFVPGWFNLIFRFVKPMLNEDTRKKIVFLDEGAVRQGAMLEYIDAEFLPKEYGGKCEVPLGESPFEIQLRSIVEGAAAAGIKGEEDGGEEGLGEDEEGEKGSSDGPKIENGEDLIG